MQRRGIVLTPTPPYDFRLTMEHHASFGTGARVNVFEDGRYSRVLEVEGELFLTQVESVGTVEEPCLDVTVHGKDITDEMLEQVRGTLTWVLGGDAPLDAFYDAARGDPVLAPLMEKLYGLKVSQTPTVFEALVQSIFSQQIATNVAGIIGGLLLENYGSTMSHEGRTYYAFPTPASLLPQGIPGLRAIKLSNRKAEYILDVAAAVVDGSLDLEGLRNLPDEEATKRLLALRGVGPWTAHWLLLRALGRMDAFPAGDLALRRVVAGLYFEGKNLSVAELEEFSEGWAPWRSLYTTYLFAALRRGLLRGDILSP